MEVTPEQYRGFYKEQPRQKYLIEKSIENKAVSMDALLTGNLNGAGVLADSTMDISAIAERNILLAQLWEAIRHLTPEQQRLIYMYYCDEQSQSELAGFYCIS